MIRPPYGVHDDRVVAIAAESGLVTVGFDLASGDPDPDCDAAMLVRWVTRKARNGSIVIMHINGRGAHTASALPGIVAGLRKAGFNLVTVGEMIRDRGITAPGVARAEPRNGRK